jgi:hypothetical protein
VAEEEHIESLQEAANRLLAGGAPHGLDDLDLADAIVALRLPKAPRYTGGLDLDAIAVLLESRPIHPDTLNRLAGTDFMRMAEAAEAGRGRSPPLPAGEGPAQGP